MELARFLPRTKGKSHKLVVGNIPLLDWEDNSILGHKWTDYIVDFYFYILQFCQTTHIISSG